MTSIPLADLLRPSTLHDIVGQEHLLASGSPIHTMIAKQAIQSFLLWGPSGSGKTTIARTVISESGAAVISLSAVMAGVKDIRQAVLTANANKEKDIPTVIFIDEIHRFNKNQQDALLPHIENGTLTLIGATTENPSFELNQALTSRLLVFVLKPLSNSALRDILKRAIPNTQLDSEISGLLITLADGDARRLINSVESLLSYGDVNSLNKKQVSKILSKKITQFDKGGDQFYEMISALHKSVRGSDPDAALYWLCAMLTGGCDPRYLARRIIRMAYEDIGLADPRATTVALDAASSYERLGSPEGELCLAVAVIYLSVAVKSNAAYHAYKQVQAYVLDHETAVVPMHIRNAPTRLMESLGYGKNYQYAHDYTDGFEPKQTYLPNHIKGDWYQPKNQGLEAKISERLSYFKNIRKNAKKTT